MAACTGGLEGSGIMPLVTRGNLRQKIYNRIVLIAALSPMAIFNAACESPLENSHRDDDPRQTAHDAPILVTNGAAYIEYGQGLQVAQSGTNLCVNPSAGINTNGAQEIGDAKVERQSSGGRLGNSAWRLTTPDGSDDGMKLSEALGAWSLPEVDTNNDHYQISFYARLIDKEGSADHLKIEAVWNNGSTMSDNFAVTEEWQLYSFGFNISGNDLDINIVPANIDEEWFSDETVILIDGITLEQEKSLSFPEHILDPVNNQYEKIYAVPPYHGSLPGCTWESAPHNSISSREAGTTKFDGTDFGMEFDYESWWFGIDLTLGFDNNVNQFETNSKEFVVVGQPTGTGYGWKESSAFVFDWHSSDRKLYFHRYPAHPGEATLEMSNFKYGDRLRVVGAWDAKNKQTILWVVVGDDATKVLYDEGKKLEGFPPLREDYEINLGYSGGWFAGSWQANSLHRNFVIEQGFPSHDQVDAYLNDPCKPILDGGFHYPLTADLKGRKVDVIAD